jgi:tetratricopeptide (TPR) repeat protein
MTDYTIGVPKKSPVRKPHQKLAQGGGKAPAQDNGQPETDGAKKTSQNGALLERYKRFQLGIKDAGELDRAIAKYKTAVKANPNSIEAHNNLAAAYVQKDKTGPAIAEYEAALKIVRKDADVHKKLGDTYAQKGKTDQAIAEYETAVKIDHNYAEVFQDLGNAYKEKTAEYKQAGDQDSFIRIGMKSIVAYRRSGQLKVEAEEIKKYQMAVRNDPHNPKTHLRLAEDYLAEGQTIENADGSQAAQVWYLKMFAELEKTRKLGGEMPADLFQILQNKFGR